MGMLEELNELLDRLPLWKRLGAMPDRIAALEQRVASLEARLAGTPGELCPMCNAPSFKRAASKPHPSFGFAGVMLDSYVCGDCGHAEDRNRDPSKG